MLATIRGTDSGSADGRGVEVGDAGGGDVEGAALQRGESFADQLLAAIDEAGLLGAVFEGAARDVVVVGFIRLSEMRRVAVGDRALLTHPVDGGAGVEAAGEGDADVVPDGEGLQDSAHVEVDVSWYRRWRGRRGVLKGRLSKRRIH